ncbi:hypothetical protein GC093_16045 [Paenibacillus sp. LMG 31456]|uniref:Uncharacterized protein n=1 Tax=Paenibacillus foliorum TaxID=2654974 RepID=A0A972K1C5_9BACL|nr:hypothetical protein [Paenibacillus foliorum]NOU94720.1 hypothetical protein [Paenibacillus foliorum]
MKEEQEIAIYPAAPQDWMNYLMALFSAVQQMYALFFCMGASSYRNILTLCVGYHTPAVSEHEVAGFWTI